jgi:predicted component of type VI protein secretion system
MRLVAMSGGQTLSFPLRQGSTIIGRHSTCHICIPAKTISRRHCQCYVDGDKVAIRDLGSSHGTYVNGSRVERAELRDGDVLSLGGFQLRFDLGDAPGGAFAHGAGAPEDIVVTAQPSPTDAPQAASPFPEEPPPAPTDFPESPTGEETPVDQSFMPAPYTPHQETTLGAAMQPQLIIRDGRWFLRDPRTGREVEIAPTGGEGVLTTRPDLLLARRPNVRLLIAAVAAAVVCVVAFAAFFLQPRDTGQNGKILDEQIDEEYNRLVDAGIDDFRAKKPKEAQEKFAAAIRRNRTIDTARHLTQFTALVVTAGDDFEKLNRDEAERYLKSIQNTRGSSEKARAFAKEKLRWLDDEKTQLDLYKDAMQAVKTAEGNDDALLKVRSTLQTLSPDFYAGRKAKADIPKIDDAIALIRLARADRAKAEFKWADAVPHYNDALPFVREAARRAEIEKLIADCQRYASEEEIWKHAKEAFDKQDYRTPRNDLPQIKPGLYYERAQKLLKDIAGIEEAQAAQEHEKEASLLYKNGAGPKAIELVKQYKILKLGHIEERVKRIEDLLAAGRKAEEAKDYRAAVQAYEQAVPVEPDAENDYNRRSKQLLDALKARFPQIAAEYADASNRAVAVDGNPREARRLADLALEFDPKNEKAKKILANLERTAKNLANEAYVLKTEPNRAAALEKYQRALDYAAPGTPLSQSILQEIEKLKD